MPAIDDDDARDFAVSLLDFRCLHGVNYKAVERIIANPHWNREQTIVELTEHILRVSKEKNIEPR